MNLKNFEKYFDAKILNRGKNYYLNDNVLSIEKITENEYTAEVEGCEIYEVTIEMNDTGEIYDISCDCPYDMGEYCKHEAAVLYALRDKNTNIIQSSVNQPNLPQLLGKCSNTQLAEIILEHAKEDKGFKNYLHMKLSENSDLNSIISDFKRISDSYFKGRSDIENVLKAGKLLIDKSEKLLKSVDRVQIYVEVIFMLEDNIENACNSDYYDEESWELFEIINDCTSHMETAVTDIINSEKQNDIKLVWEHLTKQWECFIIDGEEHFFPSLLQLCKFPEYRTKLDELLAFRAMSANIYRKKKIDEQRFSIIKKYGTQTEITAFIYSHIDNPDFRRIAIEQAITAKDYKKAEELTLEGITTDTSHYPAVSNWHYLLHDIYKLSEDTQKLTEICYTIIKDGGTNYYEEWKSLISKENCNDKIERLLNEPNNLSYEYIISYENRGDRIYQLCCKSPYKITCYYEKLKATEFEEQSKNLYEQYIRNESKRASNRSEYAVLCKKLKKFSLECDKELAIKIALDFRDLYCRRPAFMDELTKVGF